MRNAAAASSSSTALKTSSSSRTYRLANLSVPLLILWDTRVVVIDGAPHFVWDEVPEVCVAALTTFLARIRSSSGSST
jgi:pimeloyl-ACP methyl ester carboxylesterase